MAESDAAAVDDDVACVGFVEVYCAVDGWDAHVVAVGADARGDAHVNVFGVFNACGKFVVIVI